ncbi:hypothetical protein AAT19DRAFT_8897 [Rhodotorula toruloides]|uniref:Uncharacterized protein n=1 Tax=Rhodotorula toruloides TaxID=5286 RepID=A0A2T0AIK7_RHOTO|nr:hypothetical protein AAT19DRAFT_8897 [Rhodotorula toruloides]
MLDKQPKNSKAPRPALATRPQVSLVLPESVDFGLGPGYNERKGTAFSQVQRADDEDDEDDLYEAMTTSKGQLKLNSPSKTGSKAKASTSKASTSKAKPKAKSKAKPAVPDSEDNDSDAMGSSNTVRGDDMEIDELDDDTATQRSTASGRSGSRKAPTKRAAPARKAAPATIMIDDDDSDSDSGLTFKVREGSPRVIVRRRWLRAMLAIRRSPSIVPLLPLLMRFPYFSSTQQGFGKKAAGGRGR